MNNFTETNNIVAEKSLSQIIHFLFQLKINFLILNIFFMLLGIVFIMNFYNFAPTTNHAKVNLLMQDGSINEFITNEYFINEENIKNALIKSNLDLIPDNKFINSFSLVNGERGLNNLKNYIYSQDYTSFAKKIAIEPEELDKYLLDINEANHQYRTLIINNNHLNLSEEALAILVSNLVFVVNQRIKSDFSMSLSGLKKLSYSPILDIDNFSLYKIYQHISLLRKYIDSLSTEFDFVVTDINLEQVYNNLDIVFQIYRNLIASNQKSKEDLMAEIDIEINIIDEQINAAKSILDQISIDKSTQTQISVSEKAISKNEVSQNFTIGQGFMDQMLDMGNRISFAEIKRIYLEEIFKLETSKNSYKKEILFFNQGSSLEMSEINMLIERLNSELVVITELVNTYMKVIDDVKSFKNPIKQVSTLELMPPFTMNKFNFSIFVIILSSLILSFLIILLKGIIRNFE